MCVENNSGVHTQPSVNGETKKMPQSKPHNIIPANHRAGGRGGVDGVVIVSLVALAVHVQEFGEETALKGGVFRHQ